VIRLAISEYHDEYAVAVQIDSKRVVQLYRFDDQSLVAGMQMTRERMHEA